MTMEALMAAWDKLLNILVLVPGTLWGVLIGSAIGSFSSIGTVLLTNRANTTRLLAQFTHDRNLRIAEREHTLRRDVYLSASEAITATLAAFGRFPNLELPYDEINKVMSERMPLVAKIHVIGNEEVIKRLIDLANVLSSTSQMLIIHRIPLSRLRVEIDQLDAQIALAFAENGKILELMKSYNLSGDVDQRRWEFLTGGFKFQSGEIAQYSKRKEELQNTLMEQQLVYSRECIQEVHKVGLLVTPVILALRKELSMPIDEQFYTEVMKDLQIKQGEIVDRTFEEMRILTTATKA
jgi:hypothetical protein